MGTPTYEPIESVTLLATTGTVSFLSIPQTFRDIVLVVNSSNTGTAQLFYRINNDSSSSYFQIGMSGNGSSPSSYSTTSSQIIGNFNVNDSNSTQSNSIINFFDYSETNKHKSYFLRTNNASIITALTAGKYTSTSAINRVDVSVSAGSFTIGSTFTLYGIEG